MSSFQILDTLPFISVENTIRDPYEMGDIRQS